MGTEEVIELSVAETQALRATLGLPPLRGVPGASLPPAGGAAGGESAASNYNEKGSGALHDDPGGSTNNQEELALSIEETNALRAKLGLAPLKTSLDDKERGTSRSTAIHAKPTDGRAAEEARRRIEDAAARREAKARLKKWEAENDGEEAGSALDFAARMRASNKDQKDQGAQEGEVADKSKKRRKKKKKLASNPQLSLPNEEEEEENNEGEYTSADLQGMKVAHAAADFASGSTQVLTLADKSILDVDPDSKKVRGVDGEDTELINVNMEGDSKALENLRKKRQIELGAGRAGGYAGYDDEEFEETGGVGVADGSGPLWHGAPGGGGGNKPSKGFAIGADGTVKETKESKKPDLFAALAGGAVSLQSRHAHQVASDFLSHDDVEEEREGRLAKEKARHMKMLEKMRKKDKKKVKKGKRKGRKRSESDDEDESGGGGGGLLESLEATAVQKEGSEEGRKRRRRDGGVAVEGEGQASGAAEGAADDDDEERRKRFDAIMDKGRQRTDRAFQKPVVPMASALHDDDGGDDDGGDDDGADDAFLNAALAKARRLKKLKEMGGAHPTTSNGTDGVPVKGEAAIVRAVERMKREEAGATDGTNDGAGGKGLTFEFDEVQEFTRALRAREERERRSGGAAPARRGLKVSTAKETKAATDEKEAAAPADEREGRVEDMQELAQEMKDDNDDDNNDGRAPPDEGEAFGSTAASAPVGRGMAGVLSLLKRTGEISHRAGREEMRGRAKDERTYEDYEKLDLDKVVRVDTHGRRAHEKDVELANREIKLEYRDGHGRLLTRKEAYREMCYQFHGHGSSKKNQERRLKQIEREQEEKGAGARGGTLGALKKTQEATGRAFVVHKT